ncbi:MAG: ABC transporter permease [Actinomycetia bacterium]|nr:ABC transporter permease [Actinomycetes bacterium]
MTVAQSSLTDAVVGWPVIMASLSLVALAVVLAWWLGVGIGRDLITASVRAAVQLLGVGFVFATAFGSAHAMVWAWMWGVGMEGVATTVVARRTGHPIRGLGVVAGSVVGLAALISIGVTFGLGVIDYEAVSLVVITGITIGNAVPSAVLGVNQSVARCRDGVGEIEGLLSLGMDRRQVVRFLAPRAATASLIPQIERTKVVGLIALPGAMTGLLLAGVDPVQAVAVQLLVMYLILGTTAVCVVSVVAVIHRAALTDDLRVATWVRLEDLERRVSGTTR